jgi:hypothetical protein
MSASNEHPSALGASEDPSDSDAANLNNILATSTDDDDDDDDDDDMDYEPAFDDLDSDAEYEDAPEDQAESELEFEFSPDPGGQLAFLTQLIAGEMTAHEQVAAYEQMMEEVDDDEDDYEDEDMDEDEDDEDKDEAEENGNGEPQNPQGTTADRPFLRKLYTRVLTAPDVFL